MEFVGQLWLPIILSGVIVFIASALAWTVLPHHKKEWAGLKEEAGVLEAVRKSAPAPGLYMFPWTDDPKERQSDAMKKRYREGPAGMLTIVDGASMVNMEELVPPRGRFARLRPADGGDVRLAVAEVTGS